MAGDLCDGHANRNGKVKDSKAFCEGMAYRQTDFGDVATKAANPHEAGSDAAAAWDAGWDAAEASAGGEMPVADMGCCNILPLIPDSTTPP